MLLAWLTDDHLPIKPQLGQDLAPALGNGLLDDGQMENTTLDHFQHILDRKAWVDPLDLDRRLLMQRQLLINLADRITRSTARRQRQGFAGELLQPGITTLALDPHQQ
ncbi:hypothetical protein [Serratia proteamaculans]|uniref:hypothetical protein n=1 Tax=Serratia proteamaculans TaxID=28151 RepID=UPI003D0482A2